MKPVSILRRVVRAQLLWSAVWGAALALAVGLAMQHEVDELLDDSLRSAAEGLIGPLVRDLQEPARQRPADAASAATSGAGHFGRNGNGNGNGNGTGTGTGTGSPRFAWQLVEYSGGARVVTADALAPAAALRDTPGPGFSNVPGWRLYGAPSGRDGRMLYVAQSSEERNEVEFEVALAVLLASLPMVLLGLPWLRARVRLALQPLQDLSDRLRNHDPLQPGATLEVSQHLELQPVQDAIDALVARLARRVADERAFTAHAAHALRTPLAGIDAQLAVALRDAPAQLQPRLQRVREAAQRLQRVVTALLALFRSGFEVQRTPVALTSLAARVAFDGLQLSVAAPSQAAVLQVDADLAMAALVNLLDNAAAHGAGHVVLSMPRPGVLRVQDDGSGADAGKLMELRTALAAQAYEGRMGLGLMLADLVARAHGGQLVLPLPDAEPGDVAAGGWAGSTAAAHSGFTAELIFG